MKRKESIKENEKNYFFFFFFFFFFESFSHYYFLSLSVYGLYCTTLLYRAG